MNHKLFWILAILLAWFGREEARAQTLTITLLRDILNPCFGTIDDRLPLSRQGRLVCAQLGAGLKVDGNTTPPTIYVEPPPPSAIQIVMEDAFTESAATFDGIKANFTLRNPLGVLVCSGAVLTSPTDYAVTGTALTFTTGASPRPGWWCRNIRAVVVSP